MEVFRGKNTTPDFREFGGRCENSGFWTDVTYFCNRDYEYYHERFLKNLEQFIKESEPNSMHKL